MLIDRQGEAFEYACPRCETKTLMFDKSVMIQSGGVEISTEKTLHMMWVSLYTCSKCGTGFMKPQKRKPYILLKDMPDGTNRVQET